MYDKYYAFRRLMDFVSGASKVTAATMSNYAGEIEITGVDKDGNSITIWAEIKNSGEQDNGKE